MHVHCTATVVHTNLEIYWTAVAELFCIHPILHLDNCVATVLAGKC